MPGYDIIDEPKPRLQENFIVDPTAIFFVSVFLPLLWVPPLQGQYWLPFVWVIANGYLLGSPTLKKEIGISIAGILVWLGFSIGAVYLTEFVGFALEATAPYIRILSKGIFFLALYLVVLKQSAPYAVYRYVKEQASH
ncbi:MAG: hypothetical protein CME36_04235 [unclassified Hahellaceae]|nr:hypothetical protein [Hahellaceae bacterium]|tara:strand:- start:28803 stop:29216 length:414 start_codon:yes stop_codon:yes gene_type:complete